MTNLTTSPHQHLTITPSHHITTSTSHHNTISPHQHLTMTPSHHITISPSYLNISPHQHLTILFFQQFVNTFDVVERIVNEETQLGDDTQLVAYACSKLVADRLLVGSHVLQQLVRLL